MDKEQIGFVAEINTDDIESEDSDWEKEGFKDDDTLWDENAKDDFDITNTTEPSHTRAVVLHASVVQVSHFRRPADTKKNNPDNANIYTSELDKLTERAKNKFKDQITQLKSALATDKPSLAEIVEKFKTDVDKLPEEELSRIDYNRIVLLLELIAQERISSNQIKCN